MYLSTMKSCIYQHVLIYTSCGTCWNVRPTITRVEQKQNSKIFIYLFVIKYMVTSQNNIKITEKLNFQGMIKS